MKMEPFDINGPDRGRRGNGTKNNKKRNTFIFLCALEAPLLI
jgi:hypothetical protein